MHRAVAVACAALVLTSGCIGLSGDSAPSPAADLNTPADTAVATTPSSATSPTSSPTSSATATTTSTASSTATPSPTPTSTPTRSPTPTLTRTPNQPGLQVTVTRVVDGDTLKIAYANGTADTVRLLGVDTPEVHTENAPAEFEGIPETGAGRDCLRAEGKDASDFVADQLAGETVTLRFDEAADRRGYYNRLLAYVLQDGENLNYRLVADGYARVYDSTFTQSDRFYDAEADAQAAQRGLWRCRDVATATPTPTEAPDDDDAGSDTPAVSIATIHADAEGDECENLNDEYIVIENTGSSAADLSGWSITEGDDRRYVFPDGFELEAGASVTVHTGSGTDTATDLYWGSGSPLWNNGGDTGTLYDAEGDVVDELSYSSV